MGCQDPSDLIGSLLMALLCRWAGQLVSEASQAPQLLYIAATAIDCFVGHRAQKTGPEHPPGSDLVQLHIQYSALITQVDVGFGSGSGDLCYCLF